MLDGRQSCLDTARDGSLVGVHRAVVVLALAAREVAFSSLADCGTRVLHASAQQELSTVQDALGAHVRVQVRAQVLQFGLGGHGYQLRVLVRNLQHAAREYNPSALTVVVAAVVRALGAVGAALSAAADAALALVRAREFS